MSRDREGPGSCLLVVQGTTTRLVRLPTRGVVTVGGSAGADVRLAGPGSASIALDLEIGDGEVSVRPGSAGGTLLNGAPLSGNGPLASGDVLEAGDASLVLHTRTARDAARVDLDFKELRRRLVEEAERSLRTSRPLAVLAVDLGAGQEPGKLAASREIVRSTLRVVDVVGWRSDAEGFAVLADTGDTASIPASRILRLLRAVAPGARVGIALCPGDACEADSLLAGARLACLHPSEGDGLRLVSEAARRVTVGGRTLLALDPAMTAVLDLVARLAGSRMPVLVTGETGTGKELVALALHEWSDRRSAPFVALNCASVAETLFESELFGHERGAFTDAVSVREGLMEKADGGTLLLDEIGELQQRLQAKLLRAIETGRVCRLGSAEERQVDVRIVAATNRDPEAQMASGSFRQDLYFRLAAARLVVPPLRQRPLDVPVLASELLGQACTQAGRGPMSIGPGAMRRLCMHEWPGNVRELRNLMDLVAATVEGDELRPCDIPEGRLGSVPPWLARVAGSARDGADPGSAPPRGAAGGGDFVPLADEIRKLERTRIVEALSSAAGVQVKAAALLSVPLRTFVSKMKSLGIDPTAFKQ